MVRGVGALGGNGVFYILVSCCFVAGRLCQRRLGNSKGWEVGSFISVCNNALYLCCVWYERVAREPLVLVDSEFYPNFLNQLNNDVVMIGYLKNRHLPICQHCLLGTIMLFKLINAS